MNMPKPLTRIAITGGGGQIAYSLLFRIAAGELLGQDQPVALHILEVPEVIRVLEGVKMELQDGAYPLLKEIVIGSDPFTVFKDVHLALLIGAAPRGPGMERGELLNLNGKIFVEQGKALNEVADPMVQVFVVGNPCNTNCLIAMSHAPRLKKTHFHAMTRLDQNRAVFQLAHKAGADVNDVTSVAIWGNHSATQVPDFFNVKIQGRPATEVIKDIEWLEKDFIPIVQKRGAEIINARGKSSAASAAQALIDAVREIWDPTGHLFSSGVWAENNPYSIDEELIFSFPCFSKAIASWSFVPGMELNEFLRSRFKITEKELISERDAVRHLIKL